HGNPGVGYARARMENPDPERWLEPMRNAYISEIEYLDQHLGALFEGLKARGLYDTTAIVFVADHGEEFFDHKGWWHGQTLYEELLRVPLLIKLPQSVQGGTANENMARLIDLAPTMLHLAGLPAGSAMSGRPLCDASGAFTNADIAYSYAHNDFEGNLQQGVRSRDRALIQANEDNPRGVAPVELYDMVTDPAQQRNLAKLPERQDELTKLKEIINDFIRLIHENAPEPGATVEIDPNLQQQLEALGYL
ncbi:MAG TPA: sulfatase-like hydrolase/transferase, partial [Candidatus Hydrogenedentes bacterium]|nr:sulfatase-like hydrolase/transferase [Candidatus Hydrogenedentota bacterium]